MEYIYLLKIYKNGKIVHKSQLLSIGNYQVFNNFLNGKDVIEEGEYPIYNGKMLIGVIDAELMKIVIDDDFKVATCEDGKKVPTNSLTNLTGAFNRILSHVFKEEENSGENTLSLSTAVNSLVYTHDLFTNFVLTDIFATFNCVDSSTGKINEGFKITIGVKAYEED